jgi:hypothetical protein
MTLTNQKQSFKMLNENELISISAGCTVETLEEHPFKTLIFGLLYVVSVIYHCNN